MDIYTPLILLISEPTYRGLGTTPARSMSENALSPNSSLFQKNNARR